MAIADDIKLSVLSGVLFALGAACFMFYYQRGYTQIYTEWHFSGLSYIVLSYCTVLLLQDTFFILPIAYRTNDFFINGRIKDITNLIHRHRGHSSP